GKRMLIAKGAVYIANLGDIISGQRNGRHGNQQDTLQKSHHPTDRVLCDRSLSPDCLFFIPSIGHCFPSSPTCRPTRQDCRTMNKNSAKPTTPQRIVRKSE